MVGFYWEYKLTCWLEMGIVIYDLIYWNGGYGIEVLMLYWDLLFEKMEIGRVGFMIWFGNEWMMKVVEKIGMSLEGRMWKCCYYNGIYYDFIWMGMICEEWEVLCVMKGWERLYVIIVIFDCVFINKIIEL